ncbi:ROK family transcriptional regulator [Croceibacterium ferulae]|uniref:ROK family transcriptional regulator n=1 Tax=Croceibacterium ferulae TaxID=1854641 RepID=UPI001F4DED50|nr:ROK family transcriptional regulator [Croceibacterium ferulae]
MTGPASSAQGMAEDTREAPVRGARLARGLSGTNLVRAGDYNQRTVLQAIRLKTETTRVALAAETGLTPATIANITNRLIDIGLVRTTGRVQGGRGQPPLRLQVDPDGAFGIGLNIDRDHLTLVVLDLTGEVRARRMRDVAYPMPADVVAFVRENMAELQSEAGFGPAAVLGVGVAMPDDLGRIALPGQPAGYAVWSDVDLPALLAAELPWDIHVDNDAAAAALGEAQNGTAFDTPTFFYLLIAAGLGGGPVIDRTYHRGANARSGELGLMPDPTAGRPGALVQDTVSLSALNQRLAEAGFPDLPRSEMNGTDPAIATVVDQWIADAARSLTAPLVAVQCLIDPDAVLLGGRLPMPLMRRLAEALDNVLANIPLPARTPVLTASMAEDAPAIGAAMLPFLDHLLPSDAILMQAGRPR